MAHAEADLATGRGALLVCITLLATDSLTAGFDAQNPRPNAVANCLNNDTRKAFWFSPNLELDPRTEQFLTSAPDHGTLSDIIPLSTSQWPVLFHAAPANVLDEPTIELVADQVTGGVRTLTLHVSSARQAPVLMLDLEPRSSVQAVTIAGQRLDVVQTSTGLWGLTYYAVPPEGIDITIESDPYQRLTIQVADNTPQLPQMADFTVQPRAADMMPMANFDYVTMVIKTIEVPQAKPTSN